MKVAAQTGTPGKYDQIAERLSLDLKAGAVALIVVDGRHGSGMSVSVDPTHPHAGVAFDGGALAELLRRMADMLDSGEQPAGARVTATDEEAS